MSEDVDSMREELQRYSSIVADLNTEIAIKEAEFEMVYKECENKSNNIERYKSAMKLAEATIARLEAENAALRERAGLQ